jgi:hypothetical protein
MRDREIFVHALQRGGVVASGGGGGEEAPEVAVAAMARRPTVRRFDP